MEGLKRSQQICLQNLLKGHGHLPQFWQSSLLAFILTFLLVSTGGKTALNTEVSFVGSIKNMYLVSFFKQFSPRFQMMETTESFCRPPALTCQTWWTLTLTWYRSRPTISFALRTCSPAFATSLLFGSGSLRCRIGISLPSSLVSFSRPSSCSFPSITTLDRCTSSCTEETGEGGGFWQVSAPSKEMERDAYIQQKTGTVNEACSVTR